MSTEIIEPPVKKTRPVIPMEDGHDHANHNGDAAADHDVVDLNVGRPGSPWIIAAAVLVVVVLAVLLIVGLIPRQATDKQLAADAQAELNRAVPVNVVMARKSDATRDIVIPAETHPWQEVSIYARSTGYLKDFKVDISDHVTQGQLMAEIETPEVDEQLKAAKATVELDIAAANKAKTDRDYAAQTDKRYEDLRGTSGVTQQELDQYAANLASANAAYDQARAQVDVAKANVGQLEKLVSFEKIYAPFSGVVTWRSYDVGAFITANPTAADIVPMYKIADNEALRVFVRVPQNYSLTIEKGMKVDVRIRERPGHTYTGEVLGTTNDLDPTARTLLTEIRLENKDHSLLPEMYAEATFHVTRDHPPLLIPAPALVTTAEGTRVGIVRDGKVHFTPVKLGIDYGNDIEIVTGLTGDEQIIGNPGERTIEGAEVVIAGEKKTTPEPDKTPKPLENVAIK